VPAGVPTRPLYHGISKHGTLRSDGKIQENLQIFRHFFLVRTTSTCLLLLNSGKSIIISVVNDQKQEGNLSFEKLKNLFDLSIFPDNS